MSETGMHIGNFNEMLGIPHTQELQTLFEDFHHQMLPKKEICLAHTKFFVVRYSMMLVHAIDGLNQGLLLLPVHGNFLLKIYDKTKGESYASEIKALLEL